MQLEILPDAESLARRAAELFASAAQEAVAARGAFTVALSGGETPRELYRHLAQPPLSGAIPWRAVHLYWGDERCVPPEDARSNYGMARDAFIKHVCLSRRRTYIDCVARMGQTRRHAPTSASCLSRRHDLPSQGLPCRCSTSSCWVWAPTATPLHCSLIAAR